jgi:ferredoxin-NADP reductase
VGEGDYVVSPNRIDGKNIPQLVPDIRKTMLYVSGPEPMVESMDETLKKIGVP